ncbi:MAG: ATP-binding cassette domain-containing protein [Paracoccaceae bacterium]|nr:ATP-binding cassette domain-containing protein [Paracoccaceae bacterium]
MRIVLESLGATLREPGREFRISVEDGLTLEAGEAYAVTGRSGSGKTLFLELLGLLLCPDPGGQYRLEEPGCESEDLATLWTDARRRLADLRARVFGFVLQTGGLFPFLSVRENVTISQEITGRQDTARVSRLIEQLELDSVSRYKPGQLSIGQQQRAAVARALSHRPAFVIADEPTSALDPELSDSVLRLLMQAARDEGAGVVVSTHDASFAERFPVSHLRVAVDPAAGSPGRTTSRVARAPS